MSDVYLWDTYEKLGQEAFERGDLQQAEEAYRSAVTLAEELEGQDARLTTSLRNLANVTAASGELGRAHELLRKTLEISTGVLGAEHPETLFVCRDLATVARELGFLDEAAGQLGRVLKGARETGDRDQLVETLNALARLAQERGDASTAAELYEELVEARKQLLGADHLEVAQALISWSTTLAEAGQSEPSNERLSQAMEILETQFADQPEGLAQSLLAGAELMARGGQLEKALEQQKRALDIYQEALGPEHQRIWETRELIATSLAGLGKLTEAIELLEFCLNNRQEMDHHAGGILKNLAGLHLACDRPEEAEKLYAQAAENLARTVGKDHPAFLATQEERIQLYHFSGRSAEALKLALEIIRATELRFGAGHPNTAQSYSSTAVLAHAAQEWETALELMRAAEKIWQNLVPRPEAVLLNCRVNIATCLLEMGRKVEAQEQIAALGTEIPPALAQVVDSLRARLDEEAPMTLPEDEDEKLEERIEQSSETSFPELPGLGGYQASPDLFEFDDDPPAKEEPSDYIEPPETEAEAKPPEPALEHSEAEPAPVPEPSAPPKSEPALDEVVSEIHFDPPDGESTENEDGSELRIEPRKNLGLNRFFDLRLVDPESGESSVIRSFLVDISLGGLRVNSEGPLPLDRTFVLDLPEEILGEKIELETQVVWQRALFGASYIQGLQFYAPTLEQSELLARHLEPPGAEQGGRQHFRLYRPLKIQVRSEEEEDWESCYASDISLDGLGTKLPERLPKGERLALRLLLEFELPPVEVRAVVAWSREAETGAAHGLRFDRMGPVETKTIKLFINRCLEVSPD